MKNPKILLSMFISLGLIVAGYILASRDKQIVEPVFAGDPTYVSCMSNAMAPYMNALCGAKRAGELNGIKLLSPAWNVSNDTFEQFIPAMQAAGADFGCMDGIAVNIYNDGAAGGNNGDTWKIRQYINDKVRDYFQTEDLYLTETGMVETKRIQTPRPIAVANLKAELGALSVDDQIKALLIFNAFQTNPDSSFTHSYLSVNEIVDMCGSGGCGGKIGVNSARGFAQTFDYYDNLAASSSKFNLEIAEKDKAGATVQGINAALAKGAKTIVRIGIGDNGGGFYDVNNYIAYLKYLRQHTSGDFFAIAGPNEPDSETWIAPQCSGGTPPNDGGFDPDNPSNQPNTPICTIASPYVFGANVGHPGSLEEQNLVANAGGTATRVGLNWDNVVPSQGVFDWSPLDAKLDNAHRKNMEIVGLVIGTPQWAGSTAGLEHRMLPNKAYENDYREFLRKLVARYPYITKYEFWNEQNGCGSSDISQSCGFSDASVEEYAYWLNVTYSTLKSVNPSLLISVGGLDGADVNFVNALHTKNGGRSYDVVSVHPYNWTGKADLEGVARVKNASFAQEIWLTEFGWDLTRITEDQQAEYLRETYKDLTSGSYNYITVALLLSIVDYAEKLGIMNTNVDGTFTPRPAYEVFTTFQQNCTIGDDGITGLPPIIEGWLHPGIDIEPNAQNAQSGNVYSTHAGFVTYAGPAPPTVAEKGWMVQIESDVDRDNVPDYITRYTHLLSGSTILINDVHYIRRSFTPECFMDLQSCFAEVGISSGPLEKLPYGYGPYVARNQLIGMVGDTGSPGRRHVQYEIVTDRYVSLYGSGLNTYDCRDNPYLDVCVTDYARPGFFFPINRKKPNEVRGPVYTNPGFVTPPPAPTAPPTPTPGPGISCLNEITANVDNTNLQPWDEDVLNQWLSRFPQTTITGVIHMRDPFSFGQSPEYMLNPCQPSWEVLYQGLPYDTSFQLRVTVYYDENGVPQSESKTFLFDRNSDPYAGKYIKDLEYSFTIPSNSRYEIAMERGQSSMPSSGERDPLVNACLEGYVWGNARNLGGQAQLCGVPISCDLDRTNTSNPYCGPQSDCGGPSGWGGSGKYWAWELGSPTRDLIEWQTCSP